MFTKEMSLADIVKEYPGSIELFNRFKIDYCCGGKSDLASALTEKQIDVEAFIEKLNDGFVKQGKNHDSEFDEKRYALSVSNLIDVILGSHHSDERKMLSDLDRLVNKILFAHYDTHSDELIRVHRLFSQLKMELEEHFVKEERIVFPLMEELHRNGSVTPELTRLIAELETEHKAAGDLIKQLQEATHDFTMPEDGCNTYFATYAKLKALTEDIFVHIYTETSILFERFSA